MPVTHAYKRAQTVCHESVKESERQIDCFLSSPSFSLLPVLLLIAPVDGESVPSCLCHRLPDCVSVCVGTDKHA